MKFNKLAFYFNQIEQVSSRLQITSLLSSLFKETSEEEIQMVSYLLQGRIAPLYEHLDFGVAEKTIIKAIVKSLQCDEKEFIKLAKQRGDLGISVEEVKKKKHQSKEISVTEIFHDLLEIAKAGGTGSQDVKIETFANLISQLDPLSARYLVRIPTNTLRLGFSDMTIIDSFSWMITGDKSLRARIEEAYHVRPDLGTIGTMLKKKGIEGLSHIKPAVFTPILMMRAERLADPQAILEKLGPSSVESKFDGFRLQIHLKDKKVKLFSRNLDDVTFMYPDIVEGVLKQAKVENAIFEGEAIGYNPDTAELLPFQETVQRKRKYGIEDMSKKIPLKLFVFELLYLDDESLINKPFTERRLLLSKIIKVKDIVSDTIVLAEDEIVDNADRMEALFEHALAKGLEGIVVKKLTGIYQAGARGFNWVKFKKSYSIKLQDTIDCLIMGYDFGKGKRSDFGLGAFLVGVYNNKKDEFVTVSKIGTGLTDIEWKELKKRIDKDLEEKTKPAIYNVDKNITCDIWIKPSIVVEVRADEISKSPIHTAQFALRFPRVERFRDDKRPEDVTTLKEIEEIYKIQGIREK